jgi:hypothetical protein
MHRFTYAVSLSSAALVGCLCSDVDIDDDVDSPIALTLDLSGECEGSGASDASGTTTWTKTLLRDGQPATLEQCGAGEALCDCRIDIEWSGAFIAMADIHATALEEQADHDFALADVVVQEVTLAITGAHIVDGAGNVYNPPNVPAFFAEVTVAGAPAFALDVADAPALFAGTLSASLPSEALEAATAAFQTGGDVQAQATATLTLAMPDVRAIQNAAGADAEIEIAASSHIVATVPICLL